MCAHPCLLLGQSRLVALSCWLRRTCSVHLKDVFLVYLEGWGRTEHDWSPHLVLLLQCLGGGTGPPGEGSRARLKQGKQRGVGAEAGAGGVCGSGGSQGDNAQHA